MVVDGNLTPGACFADVETYNWVLQSWNRSRRDSPGEDEYSVENEGVQILFSSGDSRAVLLEIKCWVALTSRIGGVH